MWRQDPINIEFLNSDEYNENTIIIAIDESGTTSYNDLDNGAKWFIITASIFEPQTIKDSSIEVTNLKNSFWENGNYDNKRVVFHARDIKKKQGPFNPKLIDIEKFKIDLKNFVKEVDFNFISVCVNKSYVKQQYVYPDDAYNMAVVFLFERIVRELKPCSEVLVMFETRGAIADKKLHKHIIEIIENGTTYISAEKFQCIKSVCFNGKRTDDTAASFWPLEMSDLVSMTIREKVILNNTPFLYDVLKDKIVRYPNHMGYGLKIFDRRK
ncbi:DUF3800 domain-containing protein [Erysipelothrix rhusiopathiae]|nr:DUF3800 domain-containing protein [Erysipelothrix rhusiopathiae]MDE8085984.1 DUF3800 domain-containing protein [Erysipelothrix rhusiopathiae]MDE8089494.1 DUF3800 domain-containing protein [Erysipelothrix rhusiopathiae]MDE8096314.1 DUF3800 domain-containing protein [Erysipelothrix rhusiopathiae]MDE8101446.1 DUF3800 domain-containing protein [Erysipelothrix rhusiopathiae]